MMSRYWLGLFALLAVAASLGGCYFDNEEDLYGTADLTGCDTTAITYTAHVAPMILANCNTCHNNRLNQGGISLEGYDNVKVYADNGRLYGSVAHKAGYSPMPDGLPKLDDCTIKQLELWVAAGAPNN